MVNFNPEDPFNDEEFEFETVEEHDPDAVNDAIQTAYKKQMQALEKLIVPVLNNLMKNPEAETIKWPNRVTAIKNQITKITAITRTSLKY
jgi:glutaredoxin 2